MQLSVPIATVTARRHETRPRRAGGHSTLYVGIHLVFITNYRRPALIDRVLTACEHLMRETCIGVDAERWSTSTAGPNTGTCLGSTGPASPSRC
jgi:hypothetical protein